MNECLNSGMNKTEWCRANGISDKQFFYWQRILRKEAFAASTSKDLSLITDPADETRPQKISFAEISLPIKQESVRNGFHPDIILRKGPVSVEISNSVSAEFLSRIGDIFDSAAFIYSGVLSGPFTGLVDKYSEKPEKLIVF